MVRRTMGGASARILEAAAELFSERGFRGTSVEEIALKADISRSSLFWHFKTKDGLLQALVDELTSGWAEQLIETANAFRGIAAVEAFSEHRREQYRSDPQGLRLATVLYSEAIAAESIRRLLGQLFVERNWALREAMTRWLSEAIEDGELPPQVDPTALAVVLLAAFHGAVDESNLDPDGSSLDAADDAILQVLNLLRLPVRGQRGRARAQH